MLGGEARIGYQGAGEEEPSLTVLRWLNCYKGSGFQMWQCKTGPSFVPDNLRTDERLT